VEVAVDDWVEPY
jgi:hypothetical protein